MRLASMFLCHNLIVNIFLPALPLLVLSIHQINPSISYQMSSMKPTQKTPRLDPAQQYDEHDDDADPAGYHPNKSTDIHLSRLFSLA